MVKFKDNTNDCYNYLRLVENVYFDAFFIIQTYVRYPQIIQQLTLMKFREIRDKCFIVTRYLAWKYLMSSNSINCTTSYFQDSLS